MGPVPVQDPLLAAREGTLVSVCPAASARQRAVPPCWGGSGQGFSSADRCSAQIRGAQ